MDSVSTHVTVDEDGKLSGRIDFEERGTAVLAGEHVDGNGLEVDGQFLKRPPDPDRAGRSEFIELHDFPRSIWSDRRNPDLRATYHVPRPGVPAGPHLPRIGQMKMPVSCRDRDDAFIAS